MLSNKLERIVVVGAGLMGRGIGLSFAAAGYSVTLVDINEEILGQASDQISTWLLFMKRQGLLDDSADTIVDRISYETDSERAVRSAGFIEEAISEDLDAKRKLFAALDEAAPENCVFASNTSGLPITLIAEAVKRKDRMLGAHFWNPPHLMQAVEVVCADKTSDNTVKRTTALLRSIGKKPAIVRKDVPGQIGIGILYAMIRQATSLVENSIAAPEDIDLVVKEALGTRLGVVGPLELVDLSGVDLMYEVSKQVYKTLDSSLEPHKIVERMVDRGDLGIKTGKGFYDWEGGKRKADEAVRLRDEHLIKILKERKGAK